MLEARRQTRGILMVLAGAGLATIGCGDNAGGAGDALSRLMEDGDVAAVAPGAMAAPVATTAPPRFCPNGDCSSSPLAFWMLDDCNASSTQLLDSANTSPITHPAFRAVNAACIASIDNEGVRLAGPDDIIYAPDQPDFLFTQGLTVAAWINPDSLNGTQSIFRKRLDASSSFVLAIDGNKLTFALRLTSGRALSISAAIKARRFTHVAATYDGQQALLYVNGAVAASAKVAGTIAPGAGPVFVGNDANGRELVGTVDDIWLDTLAAPASAIQTLTCIHGAPVAALTPGTTPAAAAGTPVAFDLAITNNDGASCAPSTFEAIPETFFPLTSATFPYPVSVAPGQTAHLAVTVRSSKAASVGSYPVQYLVENESNFQPQVLAQATYVVGTGPISCDGFAPFSPQITGSFAGPIGALFTYAATGLTAPTVTTLFNPDGTTQGAQVSANPGATTDPNNAFLGFGWGFGNPPCLDASAYTGVQFTITGDLGTCGLQVTLTPSENNSVQSGPEGVCTAANCAGPFSPSVGVGTTTVNFSDFTGGTPLATLDASALNAIGWNLTPPTDGVTAPCVASFTVTDVAFVPSSSPPPPPLPPPTGTGGAGGGPPPRM
jgi:hypothetical protein